ncbi:hypothetical membrane protein [Syntrophus aciditrophicus SB]|uniref:Hypothetical membrane protein n=2 Tax=Syntrophus TaxID=43773 RepID=Q2LW93_SYNAS|nr:hypothetical membrane protein [Syntrophus aciditrophicus SB]
MPMKLNIKAIALISGILWGMGLFFITWCMIIFDGCAAGPTLIGRMYRGYTITPVGSVIGLAWAFFDGLLGGAAFAWLYNKITDFFDPGLRKGRNS